MSKYGNVKTQLNGYKFDSKGESVRFQQLALAEKAGEITGLKTHPRFVLQEAFTDSSGTKHRAIEYEADFGYVDLRTGQECIEDFKGVSTRLFKIKYKLFLYRYRDIEFRITSKKERHT